jgi:hypothetical protein
MKRKKEKNGCCQKRIRTNRGPDQNTQKKRKRKKKGNRKEEKETGLGVKRNLGYGGSGKKSA